VTTPSIHHVLLLGEDPEEPARLTRELSGAFPGLAVRFARTAADLDAALRTPAFDAVLADTRLRWAPFRDIVAALSSRAADRPLLLLDAHDAPDGADTMAVALNSSLVSGVARSDGRAPGMAEVLQRLLERAGQRHVAEEMRTLVAALGDVMIVLDADGRYLRIASSAAHLLYKPADSLLGRTLHEVLPPAVADAFLGHIRTALRTRKPQRVEYSLPIAGREVSFDASVSPLAEATVLWVARDVTARARADQARAAAYQVAEAVSATRDLDELLRTIHAIVGDLMPARNFYVALYDPATETISFPYSADEHDPPRQPRRLGRGMTEYVLRTGRPILLTPDDEQDLIRLGEIVESGTPSVSWLGMPLVVEDRTIGVLAVQSYSEGTRYGQRDIEILGFVSTQIALAIERKRSETALRESEERYRRLVESAPDAVVVHAEGKIRYANPAAVQMLGVAGPHELIGRTALEFVHPDSRPMVVTRMRQLLVDRVDAPVAEERFVRPDGGVIDAEVAAIAITWDGHPAALVTIRDISERVALEQKLRHSQKMEAVGQLAGGIAHDFNNLLTTIISYSDLLLSALDERDPRRADVEEIHRAGDRAAGLTRQLLAYSRRQVLQPKVLDLNAVVNGAEKLVRRLIGEDIRVVTRLSPTLGPVRADPGQIEQVILNLAVNARDAMPEGGTLTLATQDRTLDPTTVTFTAEHSMLGPEPYVELTVTDTGVGMDAVTRARVFEPFFTTKDVGKGTGLGLSTVYGIVKQSGGYIWVESAPGRGASFHVALPRVAVGPAGPDPATLPTPRAGSGSETILIAEDEPGVRAAARTILKRLGYRVLDAENGDAALRVASKHPAPIDLLLTDVVMPGMNGRTLADQLSRLRPGLCVLYMSGYPNHAIVQQGVLEPGLAFVAKPFTPRALGEKVRETLDRPPTTAPPSS